MKYHLAISLMVDDDGILETCEQVPYDRNRLDLSRTLNLIENMRITTMSANALYEAILVEETEVVSDKTVTLVIEFRDGTTAYRSQLLPLSWPDWSERLRFLWLSKELAHYIVHRDRPIEIKDIQRVTYHEVSDTHDLGGLYYANRYAEEMRSNAIKWGQQ